MVVVTVAVAGAADAAEVTAVAAAENRPLGSLDDTCP